MELNFAKQDHFLNEQLVDLLSHAFTLESAVKIKLPKQLRNWIGGSRFFIFPLSAIVYFPEMLPRDDASRGRHCRSVSYDNRHTSVRTATNSASETVLTSGLQRGPATDRRDTKGELAGRSRAVFFWKRQEIKGVGGTDPNGSVFYGKKNVELGGKKHPRGSDKVLTH